MHESGGLSLIISHYKLKLILYLKQIQASRDMAIWQETRFTRQWAGRGAHGGPPPPAVCAGLTLKEVRPAHPKAATGRTLHPCLKHCVGTWSVHEKICQTSIYVFRPWQRCRNFQVEKGYIIYFKHICCIHRKKSFTMILSEDVKGYFFLFITFYVLCMRVIIWHLYRILG